MDSREHSLSNLEPRMALLQEESQQWQGTKVVLPPLSSEDRQ